MEKGDRKASHRGHRGYRGGFIAGIEVAQRKTPKRRFAEPSSDPWSLETSQSSLLILESAILTDPFGEFELSFSLRPDSQGSSEE